MSLAALFLVALNLRAALTSVPPVAATIARDTGLSSFGIGLLTTLPVVCMGALAPVTPRMARRLGPERALALGLAVLVAGLTVRYAGSHVAPLYLGTLLGGVGIAVVGALMPGIVRDRFPQRMGAVTGLYATAMAAGATVAAATVVPLSDQLGSWSASLAACAVPATVALVAWLPVAWSAGRPQRLRQPAATTRLPWRDRTAWLITAYLAVQSLLFFSEVAWIAPSYVANGWSARDAGLLLSVYGAGGVVATLIVPALSDRFADRRTLLASVMALAAAGLLMLAAAPATAAWVTVSLLGLGQTAAFSLGLVLLASHAASAQVARALTAMAFTVAYLVAAAGPAILGLLRDVTGGFTACFATLLAIEIAAALGLTPRLRPHRNVFAGVPESDVVAFPVGRDPAEPATGTTAQRGGSPTPAPWAHVDGGSRRPQTEPTRGWFCERVGLLRWMLTKAVKAAKVRGLCVRRQWVSRYRAESEEERFSTAIDVLHRVLRLHKRHGVSVKRVIADSGLACISIALAAARHKLGIERFQARPDGFQRFSPFDRADRRKPGTQRPRVPEPPPIGPNPRDVPAQPPPVQRRRG